MYRYHRSPQRERLGEFLGKGPTTFYARFKRYKIPEKDKVSGNWALFTTITDEDLSPLTDHLWVKLPPSSRYCVWALQPRTVFRLTAIVGEYKTVRYNSVQMRTVELTDYCFEAILDYEPLKSFPLFTPAFEREMEDFFHLLLTDPEMVERYARRRSRVPLLKSLLPVSLLLSLKRSKFPGNVKVCLPLPHLPKRKPPGLLMVSSI